MFGIVSPFTRALSGLRAAAPSMAIKNSVFASTTQLQMSVRTFKVRTSVKKFCKDSTYETFKIIFPIDVPHKFPGHETHSGCRHTT